ncbi:MAG: aminotransferase class III-fold pyridoxal phosphate-dependent enzyme [Synergistes sp.]|nr:aminotransferase class III-fold pyridoxal phosphate-dependent enzyme [Synergistes sp.]
MSGALSGLYGGRGIELLRGNGMFVFDGDGRCYIDFFNGHGASLFGHSNPVLIDVLYKATYGVWSPGAGYECAAREHTAEILSQEIGGGRSFFCNSGTEAIEAALKFAVVYQKGRNEIIACRRGFHGRSCGALGLTFNPKYRTPFAAVIPNVRHCAPEDIPSAVSRDTIAVFIEPVQGEGGVWPLSESCGAAITEACRKNGALLIADEVQSGLGRCGSFFASRLVGLSPDMICLAKGFAGGLPAGAVVWRDCLGDFPPHTHGSTYGGNALVMRVAEAALTLIKQDDLAEHAARLGQILSSAITAKNIPGVADVRGKGLLIGIETTVAAQDIVRKLQKKGLLALTAGPRVVRFLPSFAVTEDAAETAAEILAETMTEMTISGENSK